MNAKIDANNIFEEFSYKGIKKYEEGVKNHGGGLWRAGATWYANELLQELIDSVAYLHHLRQRLRAINCICDLMRAKEIEMSEAARLISDLVNDHKPHHNE